MADAAERKLLITSVGGTSLLFGCHPDYKFNNGMASTGGFMHDPFMTFSFDRWLRPRLSELEPLVGLNVTQVKNRAGLVQLRSDKPCAFVRCCWDSPRSKLYEGWNEASRYQEIQGVLEVTSAAMQGLTENLILTLWRGDWLLKEDGTIERFA